MKRYIIYIVMLVTALTARAGEGAEGILSADFVSQYIWRGQSLGAVSLQPTLGVAWKGLSLIAWGSVGLSRPSDTRELDLQLGYKVGGFNVGLGDYWFSAGQDPRGRYFLYQAHRTNHVFEANAGYDFRFLSVQWFTVFGGNDGLNNNGRRAYSSYFELSAPFRWVTCDWTATVGAVPYATSLYATKGFAVTNITLKACKTFAVKEKIDFPVYASLTANPCSQHGYLVVGFAIRPRL
ncbi:MAG: hypothetical protein HUK02_04390 [Bacteroidaceae bacterium]|nr:hypothetical protein [Bacteroidaceae bacterium]